MLCHTQQWFLFQLLSSRMANNIIHSITLLCYLNLLTLYIKTLRLNIQAALHRYCFEVGSGEFIILCRVWKSSTTHALFGSFQREFARVH